MKYLAATALTLLFASTSAHATSYLKINGIEGESQHVNHENEINITEFQQFHDGFPQKKEDHDLCPAGLILTKYIDRSTPKLLEASYEKRVLADATLSVRKDSGEAYLDYLVIHMTDVVITEFETSYSDRVTENFVMCPGTFEVQYTVQEDDHSAGDTYSTSVDLRGGFVN